MKMLINLLLLILLVFSPTSTLLEMMNDIGFDKKQQYFLYNKLK